MPERPDGAGAPSPLPQETRKRLLWLALAVGVVALGLGGMQLQRSLTRPFQAIVLATNTNSAADQSLDALRAKDTDKDGLSDFDELYTYHTSPYIADSDSDGVSDSKEVQDGTDPNCPENVTGKPCVGTSSSNQNSNANSNGNTATNDTLLAAQLRQSLLAAGVPQSQLDGIDDATLLQQYQSVVADSGTNTNSSTSTTSNENLSLTNATDLSTLSTDQIRLLLQAAGVPKDTLDQYDDATVRAVYLEALQETNDNSNVNA